MKQIYIFKPSRPISTLSLGMAITATLVAAPAAHSAPVAVDALATSATLETLVITANRQSVPLRQVAASVSVLTADDIQASGGNNIADVLRSLPGINVSGNGGIGKTNALRIRGEESYRTLVLIDGMNISDPTAPQVSPRFEDILSNGIERVEVLRGPQGMMYGADAGGIVNITTRRAHETFAADAAVEYGSYNTKNLFANARGKSDSVDYSLSASHLETDGFNARSTDTVLHDNDGYLNTTLHFNGGVQINDQLRVETTVRNVRAENQYDSFGSSRYVNDMDLTAYRVAGIFDNAMTRQNFAVQRTESKREDFSNGFGGGENFGTISEGQYEGIFRFPHAGDVVYGADLKQETLKAPDENDVAVEKERDQLGYYAEWQGHLGKDFITPPAPVTMTTTILATRPVIVSAPPICSISMAAMC